MPFTPFHLGPGLLLKAALPRRVSLLAFAAANVAIDCEPLLRLLTGTRPIHGPLHSLIVATPLGLAAGAASAWLVARMFPRTASQPAGRHETALASAVAGGTIGGASHPIFDSLMHPDLQPFWPVSSGNPLLGMVPMGAVYLGCVVAGALGVALWLATAARRAR